MALIGIAALVPKISPNLLHPRIGGDSDDHRGFVVALQLNRLLMQLACTLSD
jgi:hypothetical protein